MKQTHGLGPYSTLCHNHAEKIPKIYTNIYTKIYQKILYILIYIYIYIYIYIFGYIWLYFCIFSAWLRHQKKYQNITKYIQIYTRYRRYIQNTSRRPGGGRPRAIFYISCISCIYLVILWYFFWCHNHAEKIPKYSQIYPNIYIYIYI